MAAHQVVAREARIGPWLVAAGAALWGTESAWRIPLNDRFPDADVLVFWEHVVLVLLALPMMLPRLRELRGISRRALGWLVFSGIAGSAVGAVFFTLALKHGNPTVVNVVLNMQPVLSTTAACLLFGDRLARRFFVWAPIAVIAGMVLVGLISPGFSFHVDTGIGYALICALFWGLSTVAGRGVMVEMSLPLAAGLRVTIGLAAMAVIVAVRGLMHGASLWPPLASASSWSTAIYIGLLGAASGWAPLLLYFKGLSLTRASTAGYFEMLQTLAAVLITWGVFHEALSPLQVVAALALIGAVAMVQRAQEATALPPPSLDDAAPPVPEARVVQ
ncbi:MAG TPA: DMT family transporter [Kofleriaceae bacterium]|jgi:drug/metabolite transporter (DMT)-like permease